MLQFLGFRSAGRGTGDTGDGDNWSATWIPGSPGGTGESGGRGAVIDTVIPNVESDGSNGVQQTIEKQPANESAHSGFAWSIVDSIASQRDTALLLYRYVTVTRY